MRQSIPTDTALWAGAVALFGIGDVVTTTVGLSAGAAEANPAILATLGATGLVGMVAAKSVAFGLFAAGYYAVPTEYRTGIPLGLVLLGLSVVVWNLFVTLRVLTGF